MNVNKIFDSGHWLNI